MKDPLNNMPWDYIGRTRFKECLRIQNEIREETIKNNNSGCVILTEHEKVFTLGLRESGSNLLCSESELSKKGFDIEKTNRGGMVTYHGPGQLIIYPIMNLKRHKLKLKEYVAKLETSVIEMLKMFGIKAKRKEGYPGAWISSKKIGSLGIHAKKSVTMHGFALNVFTDLKDFGYINPCGFESLEITSMEKEGVDIRSMEELSTKYMESFNKVFNLKSSRIKILNN